MSVCKAALWGVVLLAVATSCWAEIDVSYMLPPEETNPESGIWTYYYDVFDSGAISDPDYTITFSNINGLITAGAPGLWDISDIGTDYVTFMWLGDPGDPDDLWDGQGIQDEYGLKFDSTFAPGGSVVVDTSGGRFDDAPGPAPEPASLALLLLSTAGAFVGRKRLKRGA